MKTSIPFFIIFLFTSCYETEVQLNDEVISQAQSDALSGKDNDGDGVPNSLDQFPDDPLEYIDTDNDGIGDLADIDDDGDGFLDVDEYAANTNELDPKSFPQDQDGDFISDISDNDDDNDGIPDEEDLYPNDAGEWVDTDGDSIGDNADTDDDGDGLSDVDEQMLGTNTLIVDTDGDSINDFNDPFPLNQNKILPEINPGLISPANANQNIIVKFPLTVLGAKAVNISEAEINLLGETTGCSKVVTNGATFSPVIEITGCTGDGELTLSVAKDVAIFETQTSITTTVGSVIIDNTPPMVTINTPSETHINSNRPVSFGLNYDFAPVDLDVSHVILNGDNTGCSVTIADAETLSPTVTVAGCSSDGSITVSVAG